jgi:ketopantoate reductase
MHNKNHQLKEISAQNKIITDMILVNNSVILSHYDPAHEVGIRITHPDFYRTMMTVFNVLWEKLVHLGTSAAGTVLMRANTGEIVRAGGSGFLLNLLERNAAIATHHGFPPSASFLEGFRKVFSDPAGAYSTSMLRDLEAGGRIEADHILGFMLAAAKRAGMPHEIHEAALLHAKAYEQRRDAGRLPR